MSAEPNENGENLQESSQPPGLLISALPVVASSKQAKTKKRTRGDLAQMRADVRQVAFIDMIHNAFICFCGCYGAYDFLVFVRDVEQAIDYQKHHSHHTNHSNHTLHSTSTISTTTTGNSSINVHVPESTTEVTTSKGNFKRLQDAGVEDPLDVNLTAYKAIIGLCIVTALIAGAGIWVALRLHKGTDLNRTRTESRNWSRAWPILNTILAFLLFIGSSLAIVIVKRTGALLLFMFAVKLISALIVQRMMRELAFQEVHPQVTTLSITVTHPPSTFGVDP